MSDLDSALESLRESLERLDEERRNDALSESLKKLQAAVAVLERTPRAPASAPKDWTLYEQNRADIREIVKRLRNGAH